MSEHFANINYGDGEKLKATVENTTVYNHAGHGAIYDHVFVSIDDDRGMFLWAQVPPDNQQYIDLATAAVQAGAELHLNIQKATEGDIKAFGRAALRDLDSIPDWLPGV